VYEHHQVGAVHEHSHPGGRHDPTFCMLSVLQKCAEGRDTGARPYQDERHSWICRQPECTALYPHRHTHLPPLRIQSCKPRCAHPLHMANTMCASYILHWNSCPKKNASGLCQPQGMRQQVHGRPGLCP
jgi:hypothetical protein